MGMKPRPPADTETITIDGQEFEKEKLLEECEELLEKLLEQQIEDGSSFGKYERSLLDIAHEVVRRKLEKKLQSMADGYADRVWIDHNNPDWSTELESTKVPYRRHAPGEVSYHSLVGPLRVRRDTYRQCNQMRGVCIPLELEAGLMKRMPPALANIRYFAGNRDRTHYANYRERCLPIGSGITEGACKSVIGVRAKRSGQRWSQRGLTAALHLRAIHQSDRFESFWSFFSQYYRARAIVATTGACA